MKKSGLLVALVFAVVSVAVTGCATSTYSYGREFDTSKVPLIEKGKTTMQQVHDWFGEPFTKTVAGSDGETWVYYHTKGKATAQSVVFSTSVQTTGTTQQLQVYFTNGIVQNFTFTNGGQPGTLNSSVGGN